MTGGGYMSTRCKKAVLNRVCRIVCFFHKSTKATYQLSEKQNMLKIQQSTLKNACLTRWGSTYEMLLSVKQQKQSVSAVLLENTRRDLEVGYALLTGKALDVYCRMSDDAATEESTFETI